MLKSPNQDDPAGHDYGSRLEMAKSEISPALFDGDRVDWDYFKKLQHGTGGESEIRYAAAFELLIRRNIIAEEQGFLAFADGGAINPTAQERKPRPMYFVKKGDAQDYADA